MPEMNRSDSKVAADIAEFGWHVVLVAASDHAPEFAYTIGLFHSYQHPEVVVLGLPDAKAHEVLNIIGSAVKGGSRFRSGDRTEDILNNHSSAFVDFPLSGHSTYLGFARRFYGGDEFTALQWVWPDAQGRFPWENGVAEGVRATQAVAS
jgi:hypothetical protein